MILLFWGAATPAPVPTIPARDRFKVATPIRILERRDPVLVAETPTAPPPKRTKRKVGRPAPVEPWETPDWVPEPSPVPVAPPAPVHALEMASWEVQDDEEDEILMLLGAL